MLKNITFSANDALIKKAREKANKERKSLNSVFREWLRRYVRTEDLSENYNELMERLNYALSGKSFKRDELNER